jgi:ERF superfamily protein
VIRSEKWDGELAKALATARKAFKPIVRTKEVTVKPRDPAKSSYKFKYAPFEEMVDATSGPLADNGLSVLSSVQDGALVVSLIHSSGEWVSVSVPMPDLSNAMPQELGSHLAYRLRYGYRHLLTLPSDDDDDGNIAEGNEFQTTTKPKPLSRDAGKGPANLAPRLLDTLRKREMAAYNQIVKAEKGDALLVTYGDGGMARENLRVKLLGNGPWQADSVADVERYVKALEMFAGPPAELMC